MKRFWVVGLLPRRRPACSNLAVHQKDDFFAMAFHCEACSRYVCGWCEGGSEDQLCDNCFDAGIVVGPTAVSRGEL